MKAAVAEQIQVSETISGSGKCSPENVKKMLDRDESSVVR